MLKKIILFHFYFNQIQDTDFSAINRKTESGIERKPTVIGELYLEINSLHFLTIFTII